MGVTNMKKVLSVLLSAILFLALGTSAMAEVKKQDYAYAYSLIEEANKDIEDVINQGIVAATVLEELYQSQNNRNENKKHKSISKKTDESMNKKVKEVKLYLEKLNNSNKGNIKGDSRKVVLSSIEVEDVAELLGYKDIFFVDDKKSVISEITNNVLSADDQDSTIGYYLILGNIITSVSNTTLAKSKETIEQVAEFGVEAKCYWVKVQFGEIKAWIDPIRVVGVN
jgi:hypothetical protein